MRNGRNGNRASDDPQGTMLAGTSSGGPEVDNPRMRFRLRLRRHWWPEQLDVSQAGVVTNFSGLTLQAATVQMFIWDTIRRRRTRVISFGAGDADGLRKLFDVLMQLKTRHQSLLEKNPGKVKLNNGLLDAVNFTDIPVGPEWEWAPAPGRRGVNAGRVFQNLDESSAADSDSDEDFGGGGRVAAAPTPIRDQKKKKNSARNKMKQPLFLQAMDERIEDDPDGFDV